MSRIVSHSAAAPPMSVLNNAAFPSIGIIDESTPSSTSASASSPYAMTPGSNAESGLPGRSDAHHQHRVSHNSNAHHEQQLHLPPMPSTFLPSYYPESRFPSNSLPSALAALDVPEEGGNKHTPSAWERASRTGPSPYDLLDGITLPSPFKSDPHGYESHSGRSALPFESSLPFDNRSQPPFPHDPPSESQTRNKSHVQLPGRLASEDTTNITLPPPQPSLSQLAASHSINHPNAHSVRPPQSYVDGESGPLPELVETSSIYPPGMYSAGALQTDTYSGSQPDGQGDAIQLSSDDLSQVYTLYSDLLQGISYIVPTSHPAPTANNAPGQTQTFASLLTLSTEGASLITGHRDGNGSPSNGNKASARSLAHRLPSTKCLGCGATETPEWRRGPMGPRTLCNACGLVHMKLQRKKRKQEEKARAAAAGAGRPSSQSAGGSNSASSAASLKQVV